MIMKRGFLMICEKCGKELAEGETCTCGQTEGAAQQTETQSALPSGSDIAASAKSAAEAVKSNPIVGEVVSAVKGAFVNPVKQTVDSAKRIDILWVILGVIELLVTSLAMNIFTRRLVFFLVKEISNSDSGYGDFCDNLSELGFGAFKMFGLNFIIVLISFIAAVVLMLVCTAVCRIKFNFSKVCNMLAAAFLPSAMLMAVSVVTSYVFVLISAVLMAAAFFSFVILAYLGMQKLDKMEKSPFRAYIVFAVIFVIIVSAAGGKISAEFIAEAVDSIISSFSHSLFW